MFWSQWKYLYQNGVILENKNICIIFRDFQKFSGLEATGEVDEATILKMRQPRCGVADKQTSSLDGPQNYLTIGKYQRVVTF